MTEYVETRETLDDGTVVVTRSAVVPTGPAVGPGHDDDYVFTTKAGKVIRIRSMAKGKNPPPFQMMKAEATKNYAQMTILVLKAKAADKWSEIEPILDEMDEDEFKAFSDGWSEHSGTNAGE